jgi:hypothetical protein
MEAVVVATMTMAGTNDSMPVAVPVMSGATGDPADSGDEARPEIDVWSWVRLARGERYLRMAPDDLKVG